MTPQARIGVNYWKETWQGLPPCSTYFGILWQIWEKAPNCQGPDLLFHAYVLFAFNCFSSPSRGHNWGLDFGWKPLVVSQQSSAPLPSQLYINYKLQSVEHMPSGHQSNYAWGIVQKSTDNWVPPIMQGYHRLSKACQKQPYPFAENLFSLEHLKNLRAALVPVGFVPFMHLFPCCFSRISKGTCSWGGKLWRTRQTTWGKMYCRNLRNQSEWSLDTPEMTRLDKTW